MLVAHRRGRSTTRRAGLLATSAALVVGLAACGYGGAAGSSNNGPVTYDDNASVTFVGALLGQDLDPHKAGGTVEGVIDLYDPLIRPSVDLSLKPGLATEWGWSPNNLKLSLTLRDGVKFADGTPFDSSAVVASLNRARSGDTSQQKALLAPITDVAADGPDKAVITVKQPDPALLNILSSAAGFMINPKMINDDAAIRSGKTGVGTGPYVVTSYQPTTQVVMTKRADYWDAASIQHAPATFNYKYVTDGNARLNGLRSGEYQGVQSTGTPGLNGPSGLSATNPAFSLVRRPGFSTFAIAFVFKPPFDNTLVRQAIQHAVNFDVLVPGPLADTMNCEPQPVSQLPLPNQIGYNSDFKTPAYDVDMAKQLMTKAGYPNGQGFPPVTITAGIASQDIVAAQAFQSELGKIGIQLNINSQPSRTFQVAQLTGGKAQLATMNLTTGGGIDPSLGYNIGVLASPTFVDAATPAGVQYEDLITRAALNPDTGQRSSLYQQAESIAQQNAFYIPFCRLNNGYATTNKVTGFNDDFYSLYGAVKASSLSVSK